MDSNDDYNERIRQRAYDMWVSEGQPEGLADEHWGRAERELAGDSGGGIMDGAQATDVPPMSPMPGVPLVGPSTGNAEFELESADGSDS